MNDTPETDAAFLTGKPVMNHVAYEHARRLERERDEARRERDAAISLGRHALFCVHHTDAERAANTCAQNCPICNKAQISALRAERAALRAALIRLRDCDWVITPHDRMDAVRDIARAALGKEQP